MTRRKSAVDALDLVQAPLAELEIAPETAQARPDTHVARLAASIRAYGLKQNLVGYRGEDGKIYVTAGGSRLLALRKLRRNGAVPVRLEPRESATATGLAENVIRAEMPTGARVRAWKRLATEGHSAEQIMKAFSIEKRLYDRTMRLADLPDPILDALDAGEMTVDHAAAFTAGSPDAALALFQEVRDGGRKFGMAYGFVAPHDVRDRLTSEKVRADTPLAAFVGREAYEKKGGAVTEDLFQERVYFEDGRLLHDLAQSKLAKAAKKLRKEWAWVDVSVRLPSWEEIRAFGRLEPSRDTLTEEEAAERATLLAKVDAYEGDSPLDPTEAALTEEEYARLGALENKAESKVWTDEQRSVAGAILSVGIDGEIDITAGLVRPEDIERAVEMGLMRPDRHMPEPAAAAKPAREDDAWKHAVVEDCLELRRWALRSELAGDPERLSYLLTAHLAGRFAHCFDFALEVTSRDRLAEQGLMVHPDLAGEADRPELAQVLALPRADIDAMLTRTLALRLVDHHGYAVAALTPDLRAWWTPNAAFLKRLSKPQIERVAREIGAGELASWAGLKKGDAVEMLARFFAGDAGAGIYPESQVTLQAIETARSWLPPCLRPDEPAEAEPESEEEA